jgi:hypothetical protein
VRLEMPKEVFDTLIAEAKQAKAQWWKHWF